MRHENRIQLILATLVVVALYLGLSQDQALADIFGRNPDITQAHPTEQIRGAGAGTPVQISEVPELERYVVRKGDTWYTIARAKHVPDHNALMKHNSFKDLQPGMVVEIPSHLVERP